MLNEEEYTTIRTQLSREPSVAEEATLDALWSEHCSYKSSKRWFHLFNTTGDRVVLGIGEGAGLVDVGDGYVIGLGLESHNHPSAVDPFNGAATGVGGIIRDIVSQGCRPIAILDCLRFGLPTSARQKLLLDQVVLGISSYGNCVGIPNLGGDVEFATEFTTNPLVNAMCVGVARKDNIIRSIARNVGDKLLLFGSTTGRDGIGGVTFASEDLDEKQQENRGSVQIGDPLTEKVVVDAIIELRDKKLLNGLQDLGGGGLVCAATEMAEKGGNGVKLYLEQVHLREDDMQAWEILVSESQERMLAVISPDKIESVMSVLDFYDLSYAIVGEIVEGNSFQAYHHEKQQADLPVDFVINGFPEPPREVGDPRLYKIVRDQISSTHPLEVLLSSYNGSSRRPVFQQYDQHVQGNTVVDAIRDAGVVRLPNDKYLAIAAGTNSFLVSRSPEVGAALATLGIIRKVIARGAEPIGMVDSLNAGNPEKPDSYGEFVAMIRGVAEVSHQMKLPVVGGNVSLYNESERDGKRTKILPSPFVGIAGLIEEDPIPTQLRGQNTVICLLGPNQGIMTGSEYSRYFEIEDDDLQVDYKMETYCMEFLRKHQDRIISCTPVGKGGLATTLVKWSLDSDVPVELGVDLSTTQLYGENTPRYLLEVTSADVDYLASASPIDFERIGATCVGDVIIVDGEWEMSELNRIWRQSLEKAMNS